MTHIQPLNYRFILSAALMLMVAGVSTHVIAQQQTSSSVIEVVTLKRKPGVTTQSFRAADKAVETEHVSRQPGFISRESAPGKNQTWLVIVHWRSITDAEASMKSFAKARPTAKFMSLIEPGSMIITRYGE